MAEENVTPDKPEDDEEVRKANAEKVERAKDGENPNLEVRVKQYFRRPILSLEKLAERRGLR
jgi:hypothetical protein